jgi:hypothetical protein
MINAIFDAWLWLDAQLDRFNDWLDDRYAPQ